MNQIETNKNEEWQYSVLIENCRTYITITNEYGEPDLNINIITRDTNTYNNIRGYLEKCGADIFENQYVEKKETTAHFELGTMLCITLENTK